MDTSTAFPACFSIAVQSRAEVSNCSSLDMKAIGFVGRSSSPHCSMYSAIAFRRLTLSAVPQVPQKNVANLSKSNVAFCRSFTKSGLQFNKYDGSISNSCGTRQISSQQLECLNNRLLRMRNEVAENMIYDMTSQPNQRLPNRCSLLPNRCIVVAHHGDKKFVKL